MCFFFEASTASTASATSTASTASSLASNVLLQEVSNEATCDLNIHRRALVVSMSHWCNG